MQKDSSSRLFHSFSMCDFGLVGVRPIRADGREAGVNGNRGKAGEIGRPIGSKFQIFGCFREPPRCFHSVPLFLLSLVETKRERKEKREEGFGNVWKIGTWNLWEL